MKVSTRIALFLFICFTCGYSLPAQRTYKGRLLDTVYPDTTPYRFVSGKILVPVQRTRSGFEESVFPISERATSLLAGMMLRSVDGYPPGSDQEEHCRQYLNGHPWKDKEAVEVVFSDQQGKERRVVLQAIKR